MAKSKRYPAVFRTYGEADKFRLPPNTKRAAIVEQHYKIGQATRVRYFIEYVETHIRLTPYPNSGSM